MASSSSVSLFWGSSGSSGSFAGPIICPPASWIFVAAASDHEFTLIMMGFVSFPVARSFWYPRVVRSMYGLPCFLVICFCRVCLSISWSICVMLMVVGFDSPVMPWGVLNPFFPK